MESSYESKVIIISAAVLWNRFLEERKQSQSADEAPICRRHERAAMVALQRLLSSAPTDGKKAKRMLADQGFSAKQTRVARERLGVEMTRSGFGVATVVLWSISPPAIEDHKPAVVPRPIQSCPPRPVGTTEQGHDWESDVEDL